MILLFLWQTQKFKNKFLLSLQKKLLPARFSVKFVMLPAQSIALTDWFACVAVCMSAIARVSLTSLTSFENQEVEPVEPNQTNIYQTNTFRKNVSRLNFDDEPRVQEWQQVKDQLSCICVFVAHQTIRSSN